MDPNKEELPIDTSYDVSADDNFDDTDLDDGSTLEELDSLETEEPEETEETEEPEETEETEEPEETEETEEPEEAEQVEEKEDDPAPVRVPKSRLDKEIQRRKEAQEEIQRLRAQIGQATTNKQQTEFQQVQQRMAEIDDELTEAMMEGDSAKLKALRQEERQLLAYANHITMVAETARMQSELKYDETAERVISKYPFLDDQGGTPNFEAIKEINRVKEAFEARGEPPAVALLEAVKYVVPQYGLDSDEPEQEAAPTMRRNKRTTNVAKNKSAAKAQPPNPATRRSAETAPRKLDVFSMSDDELESLSPEELAQIDGSFI